MTRKDIKRLILEHFFVHPTSKLRVREIERTLKLPLPSVIRYCKELEMEDFLTRIRTGSVTFFTASRNERYLLEKKLYNIRQLYESGLIECLRIGLSNPSIVVFGSYAKGEDTEDSDIDIYIETPSTRHPNMERFNKILRREIQIFQHKNLQQLPNKHLANNIINGIPLNNQIEVFT